MSEVTYTYFSRYTGDAGAAGNTDAQLRELYENARDAGDILRTDDHYHSNGLIETTITFRNREVYDSWYDAMVEMVPPAPSGMEYVGEAIEPE